MSNPTTPFSWQMPTAADLVTDLPADFEVFGQAVATSMGDLLGGSSGYILSKASGTDMDFTWIANDQGDITGVTAGTGISVTSPTGPVPTVAIDTSVTVDKTTAQTLTNKTLTSPALTTPTISTATTNGDLLYGTGSGALQRIGIGSAAQILTVSGGIPAWTTPAAGASGLTLIQRTSFSNVAGTSTTFDGVFTSTYKTYLVVVESIYGATYSDDLQMQFIVSGTTRTASYYGSNITTDYTISTVSNTQISNAAQFTLSLFIGSTGGGESRGYLYCQGVGNTSEKGQITGSFVGGDSLALNVIGALNNSAQTYTGFLLKSSSTNVTGTVAVYGLATS